MRDTIVIGAGLAGLMGALALAEAGLRPLVLAKGQGATHWTGGTVDVWGATDGANIRETVAQIIAAHPEHPYARVGMAGIEAALDRFCALMESAGYPYVGSLERNMLVPTAVGALRPAAFVPITMAAGAFKAGERLLIAGFRELRDFFPPLIAANLRDQGITARGVYLNLPPISRRRDFNTRHFADLFDDPAFRQDVGQQLRSARSTATHIGLPAVLGLKDASVVVQELQTISGAQIFEIPTLPASVPGMRLFNIFKAAIERAGGRMQIGSEVVRGVGSGGRLTTVYSMAAARQQEHCGRRFLLATGGIAGGGIRTDYTGAVWETALDLPLKAPETRAAWFAPQFLDENGHPIFRAGVVTDARLRPLDAHGQVVYQNVAVAGSLLADADPIYERCYSGLALATGWHAGQMLAEVER